LAPPAGSVERRKVEAKLAELKDDAVRTDASLSFRPGAVGSEGRISNRLATSF